MNLQVIMDKCMTQSESNFILKKNVYILIIFLLNSILICDNYFKISKNRLKRNP